jgi:hypothetical protein
MLTMAKDGAEEAAVFAYTGDRTTNATADSAAATAAGGDLMVMTTTASVGGCRLQSD